MIPRAGSMKDMGSPEMVAKFKAGPVAHITVLPTGIPSIGKSLGQWFLYSILIGIFAGYVGSVTLPRGADYLKVFQVVGGAAVGMYAFASIPNSIWKGASWSSTAKFVFDGIVYGLVTAGTFGWQWPR
jgi:hypothetical protein